MSTFNPEAFMNTEVDEDLATAATPVAEGQWNDPLIKDVAVRQVQRRDGSGSFISLDCRVEIHDPDLKAEMEFEGDRLPTCRYSMILETTDDGQLATGGDSNWRLGALFEACGLSRPFVLSNLKGASAGSCTVKQELNEKTQSMVANIVSMSEDRRD